MRGRFLASTSSTIVLGFAVALATATLAAAAPPSNVNVTAMPGNEAENAIAVNPTNPSNVVAAGRRRWAGGRRVLQQRPDVDATSNRRGRRPARGDLLR